MTLTASYSHIVPVNKTAYLNVEVLSECHCSKQQLFMLTNKTIHNLWKKNQDFRNKGQAFRIKAGSCNSVEFFFFLSGL